MNCLRYEENKICIIEEPVLQVPFLNKVITCRNFGFGQNCSHPHAFGTFRYEKYISIKNINIDKIMAAHKL